MPSEVQAVCDAIIRQRECGHPTCAVRDKATAVDLEDCHTILDEFVESFGFKGLSDAWIEVGIRPAYALVHEILHKDLAYHVAMMSDDEAVRLTERFFALFDEPVRYFTNGNLVVPNADPKEVPGSWVPITEATFDAGVVCLGNSRIGILWVEDED